MEPQLTWMTSLFMGYTQWKILLTLFSPHSLCSESVLNKRFFQTTNLSLVQP